MAQDFSSVGGITATTYSSISGNPDKGSDQM